MRKKIIILLILIFPFLTACTLETEDKLSVDDVIESSEYDWIIYGFTYEIGDSNDLFKLTHDIADVDEENNTYGHEVEYTITVDNIEYTGAFLFDNNKKTIKHEDDGNGKYKVTIDNFTNGKAHILITEITV